MQTTSDKRPPFEVIGQRIERLRKARGYSRDYMADKLGIHVTSVAGWEGGKRLPRESRRSKVAQLLGTDPNALFATTPDKDAAPIAATLVNTIDELPQLLADRARATRRHIRAFRFSAPYPTPAGVQVEWRTLVSNRLRTGSLRVDRAEIFYDLRRLQEVLSNIFRYSNSHYRVKSYHVGTREIMPAMGGYIFDDDEILLGAYWSAVPPDEERQAGIRLSGPPFRRYFNDYWSEIWRRGTWLNPRGSHDLRALRNVSEELGLARDEWGRFVEEAKDLSVGDGVPPLV